MKTNKLISKILIMTIVFTMVSSTMVFGEGRVIKEETVYVNLDNSGKDIDKTSSIWLHSNSPLKTVEDKSILKDVVNVKGEEKPEVKNEKLIWETDDTDIYYQGKADKELPIKPEIKYFLDGKEVEIGDIVGESGKLKISINIKNIDRQNIETKNEDMKLAYTPYMVATVVDLPMDKFKNININTGKIISDGSNQIISFISFPGLKESLGTEENIFNLEDHLEIVADVVNFEMKPIVFTATSEIPEIDGLEDAKDLDELLDGIGKIKEASEKLADAIGVLSQGQRELNTGIDELAEGINQLKFGSSGLLDGALKLNEGINGSYEGSIKINEGASELSKSANQLGEGFVGLGEGMGEFSDKAVEFSQGAAQVAEGTSGLSKGTNELNMGMEELIQGTETIKGGQDGLSEGLGKSLKAIEEIKAGKEKEGKVVDLLLKGIEGLENLTKGIGKIPGTDNLAEKLQGGLKEQRLALEGLKDSSNQLVLALEQVETGIREAEEVSKELAQGMENINQGQRKVGGGLEQLNAGALELKEASSQLVEGSTGLGQGANIIRENTSALKEGSYKFSQGATDLAKGTNSLTNGLKKLNTGGSKLYHGIGQLEKGTEALSLGGEKLKDGSHQLTEGTEELNQGMKEYYNDGILKMSDEINNANGDISKLMDIKDDLVRLAKDNKSFTGISEDMDGSLKFIMKTEGVKYEEEVEEVKVEAEIEDENKGFISWIKRVFN